MTDKPTAWDLDVRSFVQTIARRKPSSLALTSASAGSTVSRAIEMADEVAKARKERSKPKRLPYEFAPGRLPKTLPIGTTVSLCDDTSVSELVLQERGGSSVYFGDWLSGSASFYSARDIDWDSVPPEKT